MKVCFSAFASLQVFLQVYCEFLKRCKAAFLTVKTVIKFQTFFLSHYYFLTHYFYQPFQNQHYLDGKCFNLIGIFIQNWILTWLCHIPDWLWWPVFEPVSVSLLRAVLQGPRHPGLCERKGEMVLYSDFNQSYYQNVGLLTLFGVSTGSDLLKREHFIQFL